MSEPEFLMSILDRHQDWATIVCLIGGGQEINKGESEGINGWFDTIRKRYGHWDVYVSNQISDDEYSKCKSIDQLIYNTNATLLKIYTLQFHCDLFVVKMFQLLLKHYLMWIYKKEKMYITKLKKSILFL